MPDSSNPLDTFYDKERGRLVTFQLQVRFYNIIFFISFIRKCLSLNHIVNILQL